MMHRRETRHRSAPRRGFTLIELLVVIAIIAVLVSILLPSLKKAKELAKMAVCASNQKVVGMGIGMYAIDNKHTFPGSIHWPPSWEGMPANHTSFVPWSLALYQPPDAERHYPYPTTYVGDRMAFECPKMVRGIKKIEERGPTADLNYGYGFYRSRAEYYPADAKDAEYYSKCRPIPGNTFTWVHWRLSTITSSSSFALVGDVTGGQIEREQGGTQMNNLEAPSGREKRYAWMTHLGAANVLAADGHVNAAQPEDLDDFSNGIQTGGARGLYYYREADGTERYADGDP